MKEFNEQGGMTLCGESGSHLLPVIPLDVQTNEIKVETDGVKFFGTPEQRQKMFEDLAKYFGEVKNPENTTVNTFFKAKYSPLNEVLNTIRPTLSKHGFAIIQVPTFENDFVGLKTIMTHKSGSGISFPLFKGKPTKNDVQGIGSTLTYLRRFAVNAAAGVMGEVDDDGNAGAGNNQTEEKPVSKSKGKSAPPPPTLSKEILALKDLCNSMVKADKTKGPEIQKILDEYGGKAQNVPEDKIEEVIKKLEEIN